jgi:ABC-type bacteriocin/lantibiotic exporter with double-glycine peptidase domain
MRLYPLAPILVFSVGLGSVAAGADSSGVWLDVPFVKQERNGCGAASISMVIQYWIRNGAGSIPHDAADAFLIEQALYSREAKGIFGSSMQDYFERAGFRTFVLQAEWNDLEHHLRKGRPLIVCLRENSGPRHYVVVAGFDGDQGLVLVNDPARRKLLKLERTSFEKGWSATQNWTLLAVPRQDTFLRPGTLSRQGN